MFLESNKAKVTVLALMSMILHGCALLSDRPDQSFSRVNATFGEKHLNLELADTQAERRQGLSHRQRLCRDCGMVFLYSPSKKVQFWMKDTHLPLDLAYISEHGIVEQIEYLEPYNLEMVKSEQPVKYVVEMNRGWFEENHIRLGTRFHLIDE